MTRKSELAKATSTTYTENESKRSRKVTSEDRFYRVLSLGAIVSGALACMASVGVGMGLMLAGTVIFAEL